MLSLNNVLAIILGGGVGKRLYPLTRQRAKPAVPIAGKYRLIDVPISNCINSGINHIAVLTQFNSVSLHRHITQTYTFDDFHQGWVQILAAEQTPSSTDWYQGTADAVRKQADTLNETLKEDIVTVGAGPLPTLASDLKAAGSAPDLAERDSAPSEETAGSEPAEVVAEAEGEEAAPSEAAEAPAEVVAAAEGEAADSDSSDADNGDKSDSEAYEGQEQVLDGIEEDAARLLVTKLIVNGTSREEIVARLGESFTALEDPDRLIDAVLEKAKSS